MEEKKLKILDLSLKYHWYDMIERGEKKHEYREIKDYWVHRLVKPYCSAQYTKKSDMLLLQEHYDAVRFHRGQGSKETMLWTYKGLEIGYGSLSAGAPEDREVFIIKLGKRIDTEIKPLNTEPDGTCRTIKAQYQKISRANFVRGDSLGATGAVSIQQKGRGFNKGGEHDICTTITKNSWECNNRLKADYRIRELTPRECFRLMGVSETDIDTLLSAGISNSQLYKLAGNSIVVNCLAGIFRQLFIGNFNEKQQLEIF